MQFLVATHHNNVSKTYMFTDKKELDEWMSKLNSGESSLSGCESITLYKLTDPKVYNKRLVREVVEITRDVLKYEEEV